MESGACEGRILYLSDDLGGGTGNHLLNLAERCRESGWDAEVVSFAPRTARRSPGVPVRRLPEPPGPSVYPLRQIFRFRQVRSLVRERRPDLVHAYFFWPVLYSRVLRWTGEVPLLVENREDEGFNWGAHEYAWLRASRKVPDRVICVSRAVREVVTEREQLAPERTTVIHNGVEEPPEVDAEAVSGIRTELGIPLRAPVVGMVANLNRAVKGIERFLDSVPRILDAVPDARFVVVGEGSRAKGLERRAAEVGGAESVHFVGYREDVDAFYALMDVSVLTSSTEGLSITLLESLSHGVPPVVTRVGGNPEVVEDGNSGFLVPLDDQEALASRIALLLRDEALRERMGRAARRRFRAQFRMDETVNRYQREYRDLLDRRDGGPRETSYGDSST